MMLAFAVFFFVQVLSIKAQTMGCNSNGDCLSTECCRWWNSARPMAEPLFFNPVNSDSDSTAGYCGAMAQDGEMCTLEYGSSPCNCESGLRCWAGIVGAYPMTGTCRTPEYIQQAWDTWNQNNNGMFPPAMPMGANQDGMDVMIPL
ncbi:uncharacterized protein LOC118432259 [Branchiostoma floridae]|uniref:Uncharacterized protein LOC118432259 n=1 Tax=Branchiostoma floridae TaxID=7739 RepID=C3Y9U3_BRAFL|nr:uncharacterized protein LOC118432259 [Branchiostoma floridae]|eukprot:XP_002606842.1 hypothetical protein BRAFLDRAFT_103550 [Branchiostoma floridae]